MVDFTRSYTFHFASTGVLTSRILNGFVDFLEEFCEELELSEDISSDLQDLKRVAKDLKKHGEDSAKSKRLLKRVTNLNEEVTDELLESVENFEDLFKNLETISLDDAALMYREMKSIRSLLELLYSLHGVDARTRFTTAFHLYHLLSHMTDSLDQFWLASKAQARGALKLEEVFALRSTNSLAKKGKRAAIEVRPISKKIESKKEDLKSYVKRHEGDHSPKVHREIHARIHEIVEAYKKEFHALHRIMHNSKILLHRTERLLNSILELVKRSKSHKLEIKFKRLENKIHKILEHIQKQTMREYFDFNIVANQIRDEYLGERVSKRKTGTHD